MSSGERTASQRDLEELGHHLHPSTRHGLGLPRPPSNTTLGRAFGALPAEVPLEALRAQVRAMHKRGELSPGAHGFHHVAIDGKQVHWFPEPNHEHPHVLMPS